MFPISKNYGFFMKNYLTNALNLKALLLNIPGLLHRTTVNFISFDDAGEGDALKTCSAFHQKLLIVFAVGGCILLFTGIKAQASCPVFHSVGLEH